MRKPLIAGNWKMFKTTLEIKEFFQNFLPLLPGELDREVLLCAPFTGLQTVQECLKGNSLVEYGAQNVYWENEGAFTGEISPYMLKDLGCRYVIVGHSERRTLFGETNATVRKKIEALEKEGIFPICCVGETLEERQNGREKEIIVDQLRQGLQGLHSQEDWLTIAYEPIWAIGTGMNASEQDAQDMNQFIRQILGELFGISASQKIRILYGGSVKPGNIQALMQQKDIDGVLVGGASLSPEDFAKIVRFTR